MYDLLRKCFLFQHLSLEKIQLSIEKAPYRTVNYNKGQYIDNFNKEIGIVLKGKIEVQKNLSTGKKIIMNKIKAGDIFGITYLFQENALNVTSLLAKVESTILFIKENDLLNLFQLDQILLRNYLSYVSQRIYFLNQRMECFTHETIRDRVVEFLQHLKIEQSNEKLVTIFFTKSELADYLGISRSSLYRILGDLEEEKYLKLEGNKIFFNK